MTEFFYIAYSQGIVKNYNLMNENPCHGNALGMRVLQHRSLKGCKINGNCSDVNFFTALQTISLIIL
jgi:hypothetical protein